MRVLRSFNDQWVFEGKDTVRLPHTAVELPFSYFDETSYQKVFTYEKTFEAEADWQGRDVVVHFEGAMANAKVSLNGQEIASHVDGYTPFEARLTGLLIDGANTLSVTIDGSENPAIPPFGGQIDYLTYAGIYRDVWLRLTSPVSIASVKIETPEVLAQSKSVTAAVTLHNPQGHALEGTISAMITGPDNAEVATTKTGFTSDTLALSFENLNDIHLWDLDSPNLYTLNLTLDTATGRDTHKTRFGFRHAGFTTEGFHLNGQLIKIRGLNRHQSYPYAGYAMGRAANARDADILKNELRLNLARTSHYPQSTWFLDRCDEIGLLVFEEIPGWQHIGDEAWQAQSVENVRDMIKRDWNHPSIILWGVRVNESPDNTVFYKETNRVARELDSTRQTGGVRCHEQSEFLEDVFTMNDFNLGMDEFDTHKTQPVALRDQSQCTGLDYKVPYMVTEYNGHMYPTKSHDQEQRQAEHVTRHLQVLNAAYGATGTAGSVGWCAFDYNTHKDFGSGDRLCYHGVMDMFRAPKFAASVYASQGDPEGGLVLEPVTYYARGERNIHGIMPLIVLTNCDEVEVQYGDFPPVSAFPDRENYPHLPHAPVIVRALDFGEDSLDGWGMSWEDGVIVGLRDGKAVIRRSFTSAPVPTTLKLVPDGDTVEDGQEMRVMISVLDQVGNKLHHFSDPVTIDISGNGVLIGPGIVPLRAGVTGFWLRADGIGEITINVTQARLGSVACTVSAG